MSVSWELRESWIERRITNVENLYRMNTDKEVLNTATRQGNPCYLGHIIRNANRHNILHNILRGRGPGKKRTKFLMATTELFRAAVYKIMFAGMVPIIRNSEIFRRTRK